VQVNGRKDACAVVAVAHGGLSEGIRGLLTTAFASVVMVADEVALLSCVEKLHPRIVVLDLGLVQGGGLGSVTRLRRSHPGVGVIVLGGDADPGIERAALAAGATRFLLKRSLGSELMPAVDEILASRGGTAQ
jgi:DNA-binding NarL/FixJ family response regulator